MLTRTTKALGILAILGAFVFWRLSAPSQPTPIEASTPNLDNGEITMNAAGCASCHGADLAGGHELHSPFGTFITPNVSDLSDWSLNQFAHAVREGISPDGKHYYPSFPYISYANMTDQDLADLFAYLNTRPAVDRENQAHDLSLTAKWRRPLGVWKRLNAPHPETPDRGSYLIETLAHCQECHTPRNAIGVLDYTRAFDGGELFGADGEINSRVPSLLTGDASKWDRDELIEYFTTGFTPDFDSAGGEMVEVVENLARLPQSDREAIADYILALDK